MMPQRVKLEIIGLSYSQSQTGAYALVLGVEGQNKRLPIIIGAAEAQAIAIKLEKMATTRPLTHDLFKSFADVFDIRLLEVVIDKFDQGIFFSKLVCEQNGKIMEVDSRTSDAVALAIRFGCPIFALQKVIHDAAIEIEDAPESVESTQSGEKEKKKKGPYEEYELEELEEMLKAAVNEERFEEASRLRDEINKRKQSMG